MTSAAITDHGVMYGAIEFYKYAKSNDIPAGPGRGSAAGSIVSYCLGITEIDPTKYNLLYERFFNPQRITMPDIDVDFCYERRQEVIQYVIDWTVIKKAIQKAEWDSGKNIVIDYEDTAVYQYIGTGQTEGIFQLENDGMRQFMKQLKPKNLEDLIAGIALYRPGPMNFIPKYLEGKFNPDSITYEIPQLEEILSPTYRCIIFQERVMQIVQRLAGYNFGRADLVRRAMSKKKTSVMEKERRIFLYGDSEIPGCKKMESL